MGVWSILHTIIGSVVKNVGKNINGERHCQSWARNIIPEMSKNKSSLLTWKAIGLNSKRLSVTIALTFALNVLPLYEKFISPRTIQELERSYIGAIPEPEVALKAILFWLAYDYRPFSNDAVFINAPLNNLEAYIAAQANNAAVLAHDCIFDDVYGSHAIEAAAKAYSYHQYYLKKEEVSESWKLRFLKKRQAEYEHGILFSILNLILDYKIENREPFGNPELVLEYLNEMGQERFIYHLDILKE